MFGDHSLDSRLPVHIGGPVDQVENGKEDWEDDAGHLVYLADAVVGLLALGELLLQAGHLGGHAGGRGSGSSTLGDGGQPGLLGHVQGVGGANNVVGAVGFLGQRHRLFFLGEVGGEKNKQTTNRDEEAEKGTGSVLSSEFTCWSR